MADEISVEYVMIVNIRKTTVTKTTINNYRTESKDFIKTEEVEVMNLKIRDTDPSRLIDKGTQHIALVRDEATEI